MFNNKKNTSYNHSHHQPHYVLFMEKNVTLHCYTNHHYILSLQILLLLCFVATASAQLNFGAEFTGTKCPPDFVGVPPDCRADPYLPPSTTPRELCPKGLLGVPPNCYEPCPAYQSGRPPNCKPIKCPSGWEGEYQPNCRYISCPFGQVGIYPNCFNITIRPQCPAGQIGSYPDDCYTPCPIYTYGRPPNCTRVKCPNGWEGEYQPDCKYTPQCPPERPGVWPNCWAMYCSDVGIGVYPKCVCKPGYVGDYPECKKDTNPSNIDKTKVCPPNTSGKFPDCKPTDPAKPTKKPEPNKPQPTPAPPKPEPTKKCPPKTNGVYPLCAPEEGYCPTNTVGTYTDCKCKPGFVGKPPNCESNEYLPPGNEYLPASNAL